MASVEENYHWWNNVYPWPQAGEEWSGPWGGARAQWRWCVKPRVLRFLDCPTILEIGAGQGRWSQFLLTHCEHLILVDLSDRCIQACRQRFGPQLTYRVNDGRSLTGVEDASVDFVFSFESLVLAERDTLASYLLETARVLRPGGVAFLHHSNLAEYRSFYHLTGWLPLAWRRRLGILDYDEWRAPSVSASGFLELSREAGLTCSSQELINWGGYRLIDCFSVVRKGPDQQATRVYRNHAFSRRAAAIRRLALGVRPKTSV